MYTASRQRGVPKLGRQLRHFGFHLLSFAPSFGAAFMAYMFEVPLPALRGFIAFAFATVSLEVCFSCLRDKYHKVARTGLDPRRIDREDDISRQVAIVRHEKALDERARCWCVVILILFLWLGVAACELARMKEIHLTRDRETLAMYLAGLNVGLTLFKMWLNSKDAVQELPT